jgi:zinc transport system ATP-binding protein
MGPNGAGKSSLVGALLGLLPHSSGSVRILGHALGPAGKLPRGVCSQNDYLR